MRAVRPLSLVSFVIVVSALVGGLFGRSALAVDDKQSERNVIKLMTDGILLAETQNDPLLRAYDTIIIDEAHERSLNIDFLIGYLRQILPKRPDLKVIITSATIDAKRFAEHFARDGKPAPVIDGFTGPQRFFLGWAQIWQRKYRDDELRLRLVTDPHSPSEYRCNGVVANIAEFYEAFGVKEGDRLYRPPAERVRIW